MKNLIQIFDWIVNGGNLNGKKLILGVLMVGVSKYLPDIPTPEIQEVITLTQTYLSAIGVFFVKWGLASKVYKFLRKTEA